MRLGFCVFMLVTAVYAQVTFPPSTPYTRGFLRSTSAAQAWASLGSVTVTNTNGFVGPAGSFSIPAYRFDNSATNTGLTSLLADNVDLVVAGVWKSRFDSSGWMVPSDGNLRWSSQTTLATPDTYIERSGVGSINLRTNLTVVGTITGNGSGVTNIPAASIAQGNLRPMGFTGTNNIDGDLATVRKSLTLANGANTAVATGTNTFLDITGPTTAFSIAGMANGRDGKMVILLNRTGQNMTISNESATDGTAANRITTMTGADRATTGNGAAIFIYNASTSRWMLISLDV